MWNVTYHAEVDAQHRMNDLHRSFEARKHRKLTREANPSQVSALFSSASAGVGRTMERGSNAFRALFTPANKPSQQCC